MINRIKYLIASIRPFYINNILVSSPIVSIIDKNVKVKIYYYSTENNDITIYVNNLSRIISLIVNIPVNIEYIKIKYPYMNSDIFCQYLSNNITVDTFDRFKTKIIVYSENTSIISYITGIKIAKSGRLMTENIIPRITSKSIIIGSFKKTNEYHIDYYKITRKNDLGLYTISVWITNKI